jgi:hypothetical protein
VHRAEDFTKRGLRKHGHGGEHEQTTSQQNLPSHTRANADRGRETMHEEKPFKKN